MPNYYNLERARAIHRALLPESGKAAWAKLSPETQAFHSSIVDRGTLLKLENLGIPQGSKLYEAVRVAAESGTSFYGFAQGKVGLGIRGSRKLIMHEYGHGWFDLLEKKLFADPSRGYEFWHKFLQSKDITVGSLYEKLLHSGYGPTKVQEEYIVRMLTEKTWKKTLREPIIKKLRELVKDDDILSAALDEYGFVYSGLRRAITHKSRADVAELTSRQYRPLKPKISRAALFGTKKISSKGGTATSKAMAMLRKSFKKL